MLRAAAIAAAFLLIGALAAATVAGAVSFRRWRDPVTQSAYLIPRGDRQATVEVEQVRQFGALRRKVSTYDEDSGGWTRPWIAHDPVSFRRHTGADADFDASWGKLGAALAAPASSIAAIDEARGWPCPAFWSYCEVQDGQPRFVGAILLDDPALNGELRILPYLPLWPGLLLNSGFYAVLAFALWAIPLALRRRARRRRNRCPHCNYDLAGITGPCPECGRPWSSPGPDRR